MSKDVYIGTSNCPLPYVGEDGRLKLLSDDSLYIQLPTLFEGEEEDIQARVMGTMWRNLPTRGRLNSFLKNLRRRNSNMDADQATSQVFNSRRRANLTIGMPGSGKTYQAKALGKMVANGGAIYVNCKDLDLKNLIVQTVLDTSNIDVEKNAIDARIKMYNKGDKTALSDKGVGLLKQLFEDACYIDSEGHISIDWSAAKNNTNFTSSDRDKEFVSLLQQFCKMENIETSQNINSVGFVEKDGKLVEAIESGRPIILDEINRGKNQDFLLPYLDFLNGGYDSMDVEAANGRVIHLTKENMPSTFMLEAIGNPDTVEMGIKEKMSEPLKDRFDIEYVEDYTPKDFTDMFCAYAAGVPVSVIKDAFDIQDDKELSKVCMFLRKLGLSQEEAKNIPEDQKIYIENAAQFLEAAECVGNALYELYEHKKNCENSTVCEDGKLRQHLKDQTFSYRLIEDIFNRAKTYIPETDGKMKGNPFLNYSFKKPSGKNTLQMRMERQGEGLEYAITSVVKEMFSCQEANPDLSRTVLGYANGILSKNGIGEEEFFEAKSLNSTRLKNLFTFTGKKGASNEALKIQEILCELIKERHEEARDRNPDEIMDPLAIESFIADIRENPEEKHPILGKIITANVENNTNSQTPFVEGAVIEVMNVIEEVSVKDLVDAEAFLSSLMIDGLSENNLQNIWSKEFVFFNYDQLKNNLKGSDRQDTLDMACDVLSGKSDQVRYGSFAFRDKDDNLTVLDIVTLPEDGKTLIVGDNIPHLTEVRLKAKDITYIDRNKGAKDIDAWISGMGSANRALLETAIGVRCEKASISSASGFFATKSEDRKMKDMSQVTNLHVSELSQGISGQDKLENAFTIVQNIHTALNGLAKERN